MSVVIAYKDENGTVWMGADTQCGCGSDFKKSYTAKGNLKLLRLENGILLGRVGKLTQHQHAWAHPEWFTLPEDGCLTKAHIVTRILPRLVEHFKKQGFFEKEDDEPISMQCAFLIAHGDRLFSIDDDLHVRTVAGSAAIGAGAPFVRLAMARIDKQKPVEEELLRMLRLSASCSPAVSAPFILMNTASDACLQLS